MIMLVKLKRSLS